jgi:predicted O-methyltransferase YrrM
VAFGRAAPPPSPPGTALEPELKPGAVIVADNVIDYAGQMPDFLEGVQSSPLSDTQIIRASMQKNDGMSVSYKIR